MKSELLRENWPLCVATGITVGLVLSLYGVAFDWMGFGFSTYLVVTLFIAVFVLLPLILLWRATRR